jgi:hypothetical protein
MFTIIHHCPKCGALLYMLTNWEGITLSSSSAYTCRCISQSGMETIEK